MKPDGLIRPAGAGALAPTKGRISLAGPAQHVLALSGGQGPSTPQALTPLTR